MNKEYNNNRKEIFAVPEGYFEQLNKEILSTTAESKATTPRRKSPIIGKVSRLMTYAAAVALLFIVAKNLIPRNDNAALAEYNNAQSEYIDNILNSYTIDDYTFYCYLTDSDFE